MYQLTLPISLKSAQEIAERINKDYHNQAVVKDLSNGYYEVGVENNYWEFCRDYVQKHCNISKIEPNSYYYQKALLIKSKE
jgi:hypothetical protein